MGIARSLNRASVTTTLLAIGLILLPLGAPRTAEGSERGPESCLQRRQRTCENHRATA